MEKIKYFTQKELKKLFRTIERQKDYPFVLRDLTMFNIGYPEGMHHFGPRRRKESVLYSV